MKENTVQLKLLNSFNCAVQVRFLRYLTDTVTWTLDSGFSPPQRSQATISTSTAWSVIHVVTEVVEDPSALGSYHQGDPQL